ncbi:MAG: hypothetical protein QXK37_00905 [Candidatus Woesearchaeota archaeon]
MTNMKELRITIKHGFNTEIILIPIKLIGNLFFAAIIAFNFVCGYEVSVIAYVRENIPAIDNVKTYSAYLTPSNFIEEDTFFICNNQDGRRVYVSVAMLNDHNSSSEPALFLEAHYSNGSVLNISKEFKKIRKSIIGVINTTIVHTYYIDILQTEPDGWLDDAPLFYRVKASLLTENRTYAYADFTLKKSNCTAAFLDSQLFSSGAVTPIDFVEGLDIYISSLSSQIASVYVIFGESPDFIDGVTIPSNCGNGFQRFIKINSTPNLASVSQAEFHVSYLLSEAAKSTVLEESLFLSYYDGSEWHRLHLSDINKEKGYIWGVSRLNEIISLCGEVAPLPEPCIPHWKCTKWSNCTPSNKSRRICRDVNKCNTTQTPRLERTCRYRAPSDGIIETKKETYEVESIEENIETMNNNYTLFDITVELVEDSVVHGESLTAKIWLLNFGSPGSVYVNITSEIIDNKNSVVFRKTEKVEVETQKEFITYYSTSGLNPGRYKLRLHLTYPGQKEPAMTEREFVVKESLLESRPFFIALSIVVITAFLILIILLFKVHRKVVLSGDIK